jgi:ribose transport system substrate-binding protein
VVLSAGLVVSACVTTTGDTITQRQATGPTSGSIAAADASEMSAVPATSEPTEPTATGSEPADDSQPTEDAGPGRSAAVDPAASPAEATQPTLRAEPAIGYISLDESQAFVQSISSGVREAAAEAGIDLVECDAGWTRPGVSACAAELARAGVSGVISMQPFPDLNEDVCEALGDVPTIGIVYDQGPCQVSLFEIDQHESGRLAGSALGALAAERFDCKVKAYVSLESGVDDEIGGARMDGYREGYEEHCALPQRSITLNDAQHLVTARTQFAGVLEDIKGKPIMVAGVSEDAILGAMSAAAKRDRSNHVWLSGQLADPVIRQTIACDNHYVASVARFPERFGDTVVPVMVEAIEGAEVRPRLLAELELVTAQNVRELFPDTPACDG